MFLMLRFFLKLGLKFIGNFECDMLTVRTFYSRAETKIINLGLIL